MIHEIGNFSEIFDSSCHDLFSVFVREYNIIWISSYTRLDLLSCQCN